LLVARHKQLQTEIAGLRSQLAVAEPQLRRTEDLRHMAEEKTEALDPNALALLARRRRCCLGGEPPLSGRARSPGSHRVAQLGPCRPGP